MRRGLSGKQLIISVLVLVLVIGGIFAVISILENRENNRQRAVLQEQAAQLQNTLWTYDNTLMIDGDLYGFDHRLETFLFIGTDASGGQPIGNTGKTRQPMADFLLLMILDHTNNTIGYIQIDRNTITKVNMLDADGKLLNGRSLQICISHWYGSTPEMAAENTVDSVKYYLGELENIDGYYEINMADIGILNQAVGGVELTIDEDLTASDPSFTNGATLTLSDDQAERYLRARMNVGEGTNVERMARQRNYMSALFAKVQARCMEDPQFSLTLWNMLRSIANTNMNGNDFSRIAQKLIKGTNLGIHTIKGESREGYLAGDDVLHEEFYPDTESLRAELIEMFSLIPVDVGEEEDEEDEDEEDEEDLVIEIGDPEEDAEETSETNPDSVLTEDAAPSLPPANNTTNEDQS